MKKLSTIGATGEFPDGKLNENDEGGLQMAIFTKDENLIIEFGKPVHWLGMSKAEAKEFARAILKKADE